MAAYYNEIDPYAAQWLRNLIATKQIAAGDVDERSIIDVRPDDLGGYDQCHFFAGIGARSTGQGPSRLQMRMWRMGPGRPQLRPALDLVRPLHAGRDHHGGARLRRK